MMSTFFKRALPDDLVDFTSPEGRGLLTDSLAAGTAGPFFHLIANLHTQAEPSWCGLGTLVTVLNALSVDPERTWKGPWRWFSEELLDCCRSLETATTKGLTLEEVARIGRCNGLDVDVFFAEPTSIHTFRKQVAHSCQAEHTPMAVGYHRGRLQQTGSGHYSPIAAWDEASDRVLLLDVARFKYPPHWVRVETLFDAMTPHDSVTGRPRGWMVFRASGRTPCKADVDAVPRLRDV